MIPACSGGLLAAEVVKAVREGDLDAVRSWLAAGGDEFVDEPAQYEYRRPLDPDVYYATEKLIHHAISGDSANSTAMVEVLLQAGARPELDFLMSAISTKNVNAAPGRVVPSLSPPIPGRVVLEGPRVLALRARRLIATTGPGKVYKISHGTAASDPSSACRVHKG